MREDLVRRYVQAEFADQLDLAEAMRHPSWRLEWPGTGERVPDSVSYRAIHDNYPGGFPRAQLDRVRGVEDQYVLTPSFNVMRVAGGGDFWWAEGHVTYRDGSEYRVVKLLEFRDGRVVRETDYWSRVEDAPAWRSQWVEPMSEPPRTEG